MSDDRDRLATSFDELDPAELPDSIDRAAVERMQLVAGLLDEAIRVPGTDVRVGLDPLVGIVPGVGDALSGAISLYVVLESARLGVSYATLLRMLANVAVDVAGGSVPYVGVAFDAFWKANVRNLELALNDLLERVESESDGEAVQIEIK